MRNHEWVPLQVIIRISKLKGGETFKVVRKLLKNKFIVHTGKKYDGYKLAYLGYDYLALQTFIKRGILKDVICKIGMGKESDIYKCITPEGDHVVLKLTRLGRNSFRSVKKNREYIQHRTNYNWLYLSRLSSVREFLFMQLLYQNNFQTPKPIDTNRHAIVMSLVEGDSLCHIQRISTQEEIKFLFESARAMLIKFAQNGLIHGDFNEFNLITNDQGTKLTVIDFPQCISSNHPNAETYFNRDVECVYKYFDKMAKRTMSENEKIEKEEGDMTKNKFILNVQDYPMPVLGEIEVVRRLDKEVKQKGHITLAEEKQLEQILEQGRANENHQEASSQEAQNQSQGQSSQQESAQEQSGQNVKQEQTQNNRQMKKMCFDDSEEDLQMIQKIGQKENQDNKQIYDKQLQFLMAQLNHNNLQGQFSQEVQEIEQSQQEQEIRQDFKGLTAFQIRQKIKEEKKLQREKKKKQMTQDEYIKNAVKKGQKKYNNNPVGRQGNRGHKKKNKIKSQSIKEGMDLNF